MRNSLFLLLLTLPLCAFARDWQVDAAKSTLTFSGAYQGGPFAGKFGKFDAAIGYDENDLANAKFDVNVDVSSVDTQSGERDDTLRAADFFNAAKYPRAHFVTAGFERGGDGAVLARGTLTIRDQSKPVTLKVKFAMTGSAATLDVDATLNRLDYGLGVSNDWVDISKDVKVHGHLVLMPK
jgi:polyisoprenoid-binding protein YceI